MLAVTHTSTAHLQHSVLPLIQLESERRRQSESQSDERAHTLRCVRNALLSKSRPARKSHSHNAAADEEDVEIFISVARTTLNSDRLARKSGTFHIWVNMKTTKRADTTCAAALQNSSLLVARRERRALRKKRVSRGKKMA